MIIRALAILMRQGRPIFSSLHYVFFIFIPLLQISNIAFSVTLSSSSSFSVLVGVVVVLFCSILEALFIYDRTKYTRTSLQCILFTDSSVHFRYTYTILFIFLYIDKSHSRALIYSCYALTKN